MLKTKEQLTVVAERVGDLVDQPSVMQTCRNRVLEWAIDRSQELEDVAKWNSEYDSHAAKVLAGEFSTKLSVPPGPGWQVEKFVGIQSGFAQELCRPVDDKDHNVSCVAGWTPPHLLWINKVEDYREPLPLTARPDDYDAASLSDPRELSLPEAFTVVAAIHDSVYRDGTQRIHPWNAAPTPSDLGQARTFDARASVYEDLIEEVADIQDEEMPIVRKLLRRVEKDLNVQVNRLGAEIGEDSEAVKPIEGKGTNRKHRAGTSRKINAMARKDAVVNYLNDHCGGVWSGSPKALAEILRNRGIKTSESTVRRDLKGTKYMASGKPHRAASVPSRGKAPTQERDAVHQDLGPASFKDLEDPDYFQMPDDIPRDKDDLAQE